VLDIDPKLSPLVVGDPGRLRQIVLNLVGNAIKFTARGAIILHARLLESHDARARVEVSVSDSGIGIPADKRESIFASFTQVDSSVTRRFGGTGLGLAICKRLVEMMGGQIIVDSEEGLGSTFRFDVVLGQVGAHAAPKPLANAGAEVILLAFDHAPTVTLLERRCSACGYSSERMAADESPAVALARVRATGRLPAAVIIDAVRGQGGIEQIESLRALGDLTPAVVCMPPSWVARAMDRVERIVACAHLVKPIKMRALDAALQAARGAVAGSSNAISAARSTAPRTRRILLVEDNADNRLLIKAYLKQQPYDVVEAENGVQAFEYIQAQEFDLVLMDVQMPVMDGYAATAAIRAWENKAERARLPIIALTANAIKEDYLASLAAGCDDHLTKPIKKQTLLAALNARFA
jgi:CheY-like chemotaxis protein